jgi:hypothetical protein
MTGAGPPGEGRDRTELSPPCSRRTPRPVAATAMPSQVVQLACTACQLVYEPDLAAFDTGNTGCPRCGGWTWIAYLGASPSDHAPLTATAAVPCPSFGEESLR